MDLHKILLFLFFSSSLCSLVSCSTTKNCTYSAIFNFGDSNSDTGGLFAGMGLTYLKPDGQTFFGEPTGRYCDGRLIIDFLCEAIGMQFVNPYLDSVGTDFTQGSNFAIAGATVNRTATTFPLEVQVNQFRRFKTRVLDLLSHGKKQGIPRADAFERGLYTIDIGQNDITHAFSSYLSPQQINTILIPQTVSVIKSQIKSLYQEGARNFVVHNTGPSGCLPRTLASLRTDISELDAAGCSVEYNKACQNFNTLLKQACQSLRTSLEDADITYIDIYSIKYSLISNASQYGFKSAVTACCGYGEMPYNFNEQVKCGDSGSVNGREVSVGSCPEPSKSVSWDGIHYTEAANFHVASRVLTGHCSDPPLSPYKQCKLSLPRLN